MKGLLRFSIIFKIASTALCFIPNPVYDRQHSMFRRVSMVASLGKQRRNQQIDEDIERRKSDVKVTMKAGKITLKRKSSSQVSFHRKKIKTTNPRVLAILALVAVAGNGECFNPHIRGGGGREEGNDQQRSSTRFIKNNINAITKLELNSDYIFLKDQRDKSFARLLVSTCQRRLGQIDKVLSLCCDSKYPPKKTGQYGVFVQACLRLGATQILFLQTPGFAAVKETVEVLKILGFHVPQGMIKFTNAVLRKLVRDGKDILETQSCVFDNIAPWLLQEWTDTWGEEKTLQIVNQLFDEDAYDHVDLTLNLSYKLTDEERERKVSRLVREFGGDNFSEKVKGDSIILLPNGSLRIKRNVKSGLISNWPLYQEGKWWVQDISSTLPAIALHKAFKQRHGDLSDLHIVDMCAAPGGKTGQLIVAGFGQVTAVESNAKRSRRLVENLKRLHLEDRCRVVVSAGQEWYPSFNRATYQTTEEDDIEPVNGVLLDVPCSATGTGARSPDVLWKNRRLEELVETQETLANHCADNIIGRGGIMVYATCSLLKVESEDQVKKLIARGNQSRDNAVMQTLPFVVGEMHGFDDAIDENGWLRVLPGILGGDLNSCDGFFVARLVKIK